MKCGLYSTEADRTSAAGGGQRCTRKDLDHTRVLAEGALQSFDSGVRCCVWNEGLNERYTETYLLDRSGNICVTVQAANNRGIGDVSEEVVVEVCGEGQFQKNLCRLQRRK